MKLLASALLIALSCSVFAGCIAAAESVDDDSAALSENARGRSFKVENVSTQPLVGVVVSRRSGEARERNGLRSTVMPGEKGTFVIPDADGFESCSFRLGFRYADGIESWDSSFNACKASGTVRAQVTPSSTDGGAPDASSTTTSSSSGGSGAVPTKPPPSDDGCYDEYCDDYDYEKKK